jgi:hypothetical protein
MWLRIILSIVLAATPVLAPASALARTQDPTFSEQDFNRLMGDLGRWVAGPQAVIAESTVYSGVVIDGVTAAVEPGLKGKAGEAWARDWVQKVDRDGEALLARARAVQPMSPALVAQLKRLGPEGDRMIAAFQRYPAQIEAYMVDLVGFKNTVKPLVIRAAAGDAKAKDELGIRTLGGMRVVLQGENRLMDLSLALSPAGNPQGALTRAMLESNNALIALLAAQEKLMLDPNADASADIAEARARVADGRKQADLIWPYAQRTKGTFDALPDGATKTRMLSVLDSFRDSAAIERQILDIMDAYADVLAGKGDFDGLEARMNELQSLIDRRVALVERRSRMTTGL